MIDSHVSMNFGQEGFQERQMRDQTFRGNFEIIADEIDSIKIKAAKLKGLWGATDLHQSQWTSLPTGQSRFPSIGKNDMVGFRKDLMEIKDRLTGNQATLQIIQVTGMGGIGKTTLARNIYNDPLIEYHFHTRAWVSISQEYREREVLLSLLDSMKQLGAKMRQENNVEKLRERLYKSLKGMRYLVVMDDVWNSEAWDSLRGILPDDWNGSRIMLTSRLLSVVDSHNSPHHMQFLNESDSWNLLRQKVFGEDCCPLELEVAGKEIAENCRGLPLSLVVMGGHLSKANKTKDYWEYVAQYVKKFITAKDTNCSEILSLSYDNLPHYLKACFLYMGVFPEDDEIRVSKLTKLWAAEGFLKPVIGKTLDEVAEENLGDLISRNLILINKKSSRGKIKSCSIHDLLRDLCISKAQEEKIFHVTDKDVSIFAEGIQYSRRLCINPDIFHKNKKLSDSENSNVNPSMEFIPPVRSIICSDFASEIYESGDGNFFPLLRVLDLAKGKVDGFPIGEVKLVHSRYLAFSFDGNISIPKTLPVFLWYLHTLIVDCDEVHLPEEIWKMPQLRHLLFGMCYLPCPSRSPIDGENLVLGNLLTLSNVSSASCTKEVFERVPNLNKLGILTELFELTPFSLGNLPRLETLKIRNEYKRVSVPMSFTFPPNIKKLTLDGFRITWKHMTIVGSMPNLEVLKLLYNAFEGPGWEPTEGKFCKLKYLLLQGIDVVQWRADNTHFPRLECLVLRECFKLEEIPCSIGYIQTLRIIDLDDASPSAVTSAEKIKEEQHEYWGNYSLHVSVRNMFQFSRLLRKEAEAEIIANVGSNDDEVHLQLRRILSSDPVEDVSGVVPRLIEFLARDDNPQLQFEAALVITSISDCSSDNINILIGHGAVPMLVSLLSSPKDHLREEALEVLGIFAGDSTESRDIVLSCGVLMPLLTHFNDKSKLSIMRKATLTLSNLCRGKPEPQFEQVKSALLPLAHLIHIDDREVLKNVCWALSDLTTETEDIIPVVIDAGVFPRLVKLLLYPSPFVWIPALYTVSNILPYVDDIQIQDITDDCHLLFLLNLLTQNYKNNVKYDAIWIISKIIERTKDNIQAVIEAGIILPLVKLLQNDDFDIQEAAARALSVVTEGTNEQIKFLVHEGCIKPMCDLLLCPIPNKVDIIKCCLYGLVNILNVGEAEKDQGNSDDVNVFAQMIDDVGGLWQIKNLQTHDDSEICEMAVKILETYWQEPQSGCFCCTFIDHFLCFLT